MSVQRTPMTRGGFERLRDELDRLKRVDRHAITKAIAEARAHGDLSENAEYHAAREKQSFIEGRIAELEGKVGGAEVIDPPTSGDRVTFASTVLLEDENGKEIRYQIVGSDEADPSKGRISIMSPLARTLIGKNVDDRVNIHYEESGQGLPLVFVHEFAGDHRSWHLQMRFFSRRYRAIAFNARGYPPSDVPDDVKAYSQERAAEDIRGVLDGLKIPKAHVCGLSMGGYATLHFGLRHPDRALSLVVAGAGYGSVAGEREKVGEDTEVVARRFE